MDNFDLKKYLKEGKLLKEDRFIVMYRRKDSEALKKKGFDPVSQSRSRGVS